MKHPANPHLTGPIRLVLMVGVRCTRQDEADEPGQDGTIEALGSGMEESNLIDD